MWPQVSSCTLNKKNGDDEQEEEEEGDDAGGNGHEVLHLHLHHRGPLCKALHHQGVVGPAGARPVFRRADVGSVLSQGGVQDQQLAPEQGRSELNCQKGTICTWQLSHPPAAEPP